MAKKFHQIGDRVVTQIGNLGTIESAYDEDIWEVLLDNGNRIMANDAYLEIPPSQFKVGDRVATPSGHLGVIIYRTQSKYRAWIVDLDNGDRVPIEDANLSPAPENTMTSKMTLNHRQPTPEPPFRKGDIVVSQSEIMIVVTDYQDPNTKLFSGTVIHPGNSVCAAGHTKCDWAAGAFTRLDGTVLLEQSP